MQQFENFVIGVCSRRLRRSKNAFEVEQYGKITNYCIWNRPTQQRV